MPPLPNPVRVLILLNASLLLMSCETTKSGADDPYASNYGSDGRYNPYPGQSGYVQPQRGSYQPPSYEAPPAPVQPDPYAFQAPAPAPKPMASTTPKKSTSTTAAAKPKPATTAKKASGSSSYTVVKGDTLYGIALKKGSSVAKIKTANGLSSDLIRIGQTLKIP